MLRRITLLVACPLVALVGCGNSRTLLPDLAQPAPAGRFHTLSYRQAGISFSAPRSWASAPQRSPLVAVVSSGAAVIAVWRYVRSQPLPRTQAALARARIALIRAASVHPGFHMIRSRTLTVDGAPAIELDAFERVNGQPRRVRSTHVYAYGAEIVLDEYSPVATFHPVDHAVFSPLKRSLLIFSPTATS